MNVEQLLKNTLVPYYPKVNNNQHLNEISLWDWITFYSTKFMSIINTIRVTKKTDEKQSKLLKSKLLPCVSISARIKGTRKVENIYHHNPIICIDIDKGDNPNITDWNEVKKTVMQLPYVFFASLSCRGDGVFCFVYYDTNKDFIKVWKSLEQEFKQIGIVIDQNCKDEIRLRFISYDKDSKIRKDVTLYDKEYEEKEEQPKLTMKYYNNNLSTDDAFTYKAIYYLITELNYRADTYQEWLLDAFRLATFGTYGEILFMSLSQQSSNYSPRAAQNKFREAIKTTRMNKNCLSYYFSKLKTSLGPNWRQIIEEYST